MGLDPRSRPPAAIIRRPLAHTKSGRPGLWECGGGRTNTGEATVIADAEGYALRPFFVRTGGDLAGGNHALFPATVGNLVITVDRQRDDLTVTISRIVSVTETEAVLEIINRLDRWEWDTPLTPAQAAAVAAATAKSRCYHCRHAHYIA